MKGKLNVYICPAGHQTVTVDRDEGTTPFMTGCTMLGCEQTATSHFYRVPQTLKATHEWFAPTPEELEVFCKSAVERLRPKWGPAADGVADNIRDHVTRGGLLLRCVATGETVE